MRRLTDRVVPLLLLVLLASGCGGSGDDGADDSVAPSTVPATTAASATSTAPELAEPPATTSAAGSDDGERAGVDATTDTGGGLRSLFDSVTADDWIGNDSEQSACVGSALQPDTLELLIADDPPTAEAMRDLISTYGACGVDLGPVVGIDGVGTPELDCLFGQLSDPTLAALATGAAPDMFQTRELLSGMELCGVSLDAALEAAGAFDGLGGIEGDQVVCLFGELDDETIAALDSEATPSAPQLRDVLAAIATCDIQADALLPAAAGLGDLDIDQVVCLFDGLGDDTLDLILSGGEPDNAALADLFDAFTDCDIDLSQIG